MLEEEFLPLSRENKIVLKIVVKISQSQFGGHKCPLLGRDVASLLHEASPVVPEAVVESQLVLQLLRLLHARVRVLPFKRSQPEKKDFHY